MWVEISQKRFTWCISLMRNGVKLVFTKPFLIIKAEIKLNLREKNSFQNNQLEIIRKNENNLLTFNEQITKLNDVEELSTAKMSKFVKY